MKNFILFMETVTQELKSSGHYGTAHIYRSSLNALTAFNKSKNLPFEKITPCFLLNFEVYLRTRGCGWNTISTYMRMVRAVYNRAVDQRIAVYEPRLFRHVYTGTKAEKKRALDKQDMALFVDEETCSHTSDKALAHARDIFLLMFLLRGIPFVDLAYMKKHDMKGDVITYRRKKTKRLLTIALLPEAVKLIKQHMNTGTDTSYLFSFINSSEGTEKAYKEYQLALRNFNHQLSLLKVSLGMATDLSSYAARHTWATMAYHCEIHPGVISEAMGHSSIAVTETYLKPFRNQKIDEANSLVFSSLKDA